MNEKEKKLDFKSIFKKEKSNDKESELFKLIQEVFNSTDNIELKTELSNPIGWSAYTTLMELVKKFGFELGYKLMEKYRQTAFIYSTSKNRKSREEIVKAIGNSNLNLDKETDNKIVGSEIL